MWNSLAQISFYFFFVFLFIPTSSFTRQLLCHDGHTRQKISSFQNVYAILKMRTLEIFSYAFFLNDRIAYKIQKYFAFSVNNFLHKNVHYNFDNSWHFVFHSKIAIEISFAREIVIGYYKKWIVSLLLQLLLVFWLFLILSNQWPEISLYSFIWWMFLSFGQFLFFTAHSRCNSLFFFIANNRFGCIVFRFY